MFFCGRSLTSVRDAQKFVGFVCALRSCSTPSAFRGDLRVNHSGIGDCQIELRDSGEVLMFMRGGIVVNVHSKDIALAKALDDLIVARTKEHFVAHTDNLAIDLCGIAAKTNFVECLTYLDFNRFQRHPKQVEPRRKSEAQEGDSRGAHGIWCRPEAPRAQPPPQDFAAGLEVIQLLYLKSVSVLVP